MATYNLLDLVNTFEERICALGVGSKFKENPAWERIVLNFKSVIEFF